MHLKFQNMKKNTLYIVIAAVLVVAAIIAVLFKTGVIKSSDDHLSFDAFAIKDTNNITKIFLADMQGEYVLLQRTNAGWVVQDSILVMKPIMEEFLTTIASLSVKQVVPKTGQSTINKVLSTSAIKVDIYQTKPKFKIFGMAFGVKERKTKTYYMGPATMDNLSNFALLEALTILISCMCLVSEVSPPRFIPLIMPIGLIMISIRLKSLVSRLLNLLIWSIQKNPLRQ